MRWYYAAFQKILLFPLTLFLLYFSIVHCIMMIRYGRKWMRYEKAWDEMERFQEFSPYGTMGSAVPSAAPGLRFNPQSGTMGKYSSIATAVTYVPAVAQIWSLDHVLLMLWGGQK